MPKNIKILAEHKKVIKENPPPSRERMSYHKWDSEESKTIFNSNIQTSSIFDIYISKKAEEKMMNHCMSGVPSRTEVMGLLIGDVYRYNNMTYTIAKDIITTELEANAIHVQISKEDSSYEKLFQRMDEIGGDFLVIGWYHSHPGHTCFLSETDLNTQRKMFSEAYQSAIVIDPITKQFEVFTLDDKGGYIRRSHAIFWDEFEEPYKMSELPEQVEDQRRGMEVQAEWQKSSMDLARKEALLKQREIDLNEQYKILQSRLNEIKVREELLSRNNVNIAKWQEELNRAYAEKADVENLRRTLASREAELNSSRVQLSAKEKILNDRENEMLKKEQMLSNASMYTGKINEERAALNNERARLERIARLQAGKEEEIKKKSAEIGEKENSLRNWELNLAKREEETSQYRDLSAKIRADMEAINMERSNLQLTINSITSNEKKLQAKEKELKDKEIELASLGMIPSLKEELERREERIKNSESELAARESAVESREKAVSEKQNIADTKERELATSANRLHNFELELKSRETSLKMKESEIEQKLDEMKNRETELGKREIAINELKSKFDQGISDNRKRQQALAEKEKELSRREEQLTNEKSLIDSYNEKLKKKESMMKVLTDTFEKAVKENVLNDVADPDNLYKKFYTKAENELSVMAEEYLNLQKNIQKLLVETKKTNKALNETISSVKSKRGIKTIWKKAAK